MEPAGEAEADQAVDAFGDQPAAGRRRSWGVTAAYLDDTAKAPGDPGLGL
jgi:hypothetical protein